MRGQAGELETVGRPVIIGILEYGEVRIYDDLAHVMREWGSHPTDIGNVIDFYDDSGNWIQPTFSSGPRRWFGLLPGFISVSLRVSERNDTVDPLSLALHEADSLVPNPHVVELGELRQRFPLE